MSLLAPLAQRLEQFVYDGVCSIARWSDQDGERGHWLDPLATPEDGNPRDRRH